MNARSVERIPENAIPGQAKPLASAAHVLLRKAALTVLHVEVTRMKKTLGTLFAALTIALTIACTSAPREAQAQATAEPPIYTFVSMPDFLNADIGDVTDRAGWDPGDGNSINSAWRTAMSTVINEVATHNPDGVFVAGDLVEGHWGQDVDQTGIFGPVGTDAEKVSAMRAAANTYYKQWKDRYTAAGIDPARVYEAVGDHELGDNDWPTTSWKYDHMPEFKDAWADQFTRSFDTSWRFGMHPSGTDYDETAYAKWLVPHTDTAPGVMLITLDAFNRKPDGVHITITGGQLTWLKGILDKTVPADTVIVQSHVPVLQPVRVYGSSGLKMEGGSSSDFWATLEAAKVDLYLCGEVHDNTARQKSGGYTVQISHGGLLHNTRNKYIVGQVFADGTVNIEAHSFSGTYAATPELWATSSRRPPANIALDGPSTISGGMTIYNGTVLADFGDMALNPDLS